MQKFPFVDAIALFAAAGAHAQAARLEHETVVRLSEALDARLGWRQPHAHE